MSFTDAVVVCSLRLLPFNCSITAREQNVTTAAVIAAEKMRGRQIFRGLGKKRWETWRGDRDCDCERRRKEWEEGENRRPEWELRDGEEDAGNKIRQVRGQWAGRNRSRLGLRESPKRYLRDCQRLIIHPLHALSYNTLLYMHLHVIVCREQSEGDERNRKKRSPSS